MKSSQRDHSANRVVTPGVLCVLRWLKLFFMQVKAAVIDNGGIGTERMPPIGSFRRLPILETLFEKTGGAFFIQLRLYNRGNGDSDAQLCFPNLDRKSTRLNSSHLGISYAVFC